MHLLFALLLVTSAACVIARPPDMPPTPKPNDVIIERAVPPRMTEIREIFLPRYVSYNDRPRFIPFPPVDYDHRIDWLTQEINHLNAMLKSEEESESYLMDQPNENMELGNNNMSVGDLYEERIPEPLVDSEDVAQDNTQYEEEQHDTIEEENESEDDIKSDKSFALTPLDKGYFYGLTGKQFREATPASPNEEEPSVVIEPMRQIRQNPNLSKTKNLVAESLERLRSSVSEPETETLTPIPGPIHIVETNSVEDPTTSLYGVTLIAAVGAALTVAVFGFAFGWYTLSKRAKAAADVDYPAYGVTGPTIDTSGDRKLAQSAHMYHYQHQKQQIIAMERNGASGSVSDPESEEENEEGDYTVYECPGFATTGDMEVKNPLFSDDPTPATPGKCEVVKQQPKD